MSESFASSKEMLNYHLAKHYTDAAEAKAAGKLVCWSTAVAPIEILTAFGITTTFPENHCAAVGARKQSLPMLELADAQGYPVDICSYTRINFGYAEVFENKAANMPRPDVLFACSDTCYVVIKWFEALSRKFDIPLIVIDTPYNTEDQVSDRSIRYIKNQMLTAIKRLEGITGKAFDEDAFQMAMKYSEETINLWAEACAYAKHTLSPMNGFDMFNYMATVVFMRCSEIGPRLLRMWIEELKKRVADGRGPWEDQEEKYRIFWDGIICWPYLSGILGTLKNRGINMIASNYPKLWTLLYTAGDLDSVAKAYAECSPNRSMNSNVEVVSELVKDYNIEGVLYHSNRSCKLMCMKQFEMQRQVSANTGTPAMSFDGDQTDPGAFSMAQFENRLQALCEMMDARKEARHG